MAIYSGHAPLRLKALTVLLAGLCAASAASAQVVFTPLGDLPGGVFESEAWGVSADGRVVAGRSQADAGWQAFRWEDGVLVGLGSLPGGSAISAAYAISDDGSVIAGSASANEGTLAFRWQDGVMTALPSAPGASGGVVQSATPDGSILVGYSYGATRWVGDVPTALPGMDHSRGVSDDGSVVGGHGVYCCNPYATKAALWVDGSFVPLGVLPGGQGSNATDVSGDGSVAVGWGGPVAFRWTEATGMVSIGDLPGGDEVSVAWAVSSEGSVIVGVGQTELGSEAFVWSASTGMRRLQTVVQEDLGFDIGAWVLSAAMNLSRDGRFIVGTGINPAGDSEAWLLEVPDGDADGRTDIADNCLGVHNPDQADADVDGVGDACEAACADGLDNDADGFTDLADPGCRDASSSIENPACSDGINNDPGEDSFIDFDGGASAGLSIEEQTAPDPQCTGIPWINRETAPRPGGCGLGFELTLILAAIRLRRSPRRC